MHDLYTQFVNYISNLEKSDCKILLHHNADPDAICAAEALGLLLKQLNKDLTYRLYSDGANLSSSRIIEEFEIEVLENTPTWASENDRIIITMDTANFSQLGKFESWIEEQQSPLLVIDHHDTNEVAGQAIASFVDQTASSTCIMISKLFEETKIEPSPRIATLLVSGHIYDSRRFLYGSSEGLFRQISWLISCGADYDQANTVLQNEMSHGERIARFKAASRLKYHTLKGGIIVVTSRIGAYEASVARNFIVMGADISLVIASRDDELRGSGRVNSSVELNIGEVLSDLAEEFGGSGGGHAAAAGFNIAGSVSRKDQKQLISRFIEIIREKLA